MKMKIILYTTALFLAGCFGCSQPKEWEELFNGKDLDGWQAYESPESFQVKDGELVCSGKRGHLFFEGEVYKNFELIAEVKAAPGANSGIFIHTKPQEEGWPSQGYEVQINNTHKGEGNYRETKKTGSLYGVRNVYYQSAKDNEWFTLRVKVVENLVQIFVDNMPVVEYIEPEAPVRGEGCEGRKLSEGYFALQAHDENSTVHFRSIKVKRLPDAAKTPMKVSEEWNSTVTKLMEKGYPLVDYHVHLKGGLTMEEARENSLKLGINYGVAPNCGLHFPVTNDASLYTYMDTVKHQPIFRGMQAEGREWIRLFSPKAIAEFDYVFTDAMTFTDSKGRRNRIWIPEEVWVDDKEQFMDQMVEKIESIFAKEPVDIYVNPTVLPAELMPEIDELWTEERWGRVVNVLAEHKIAIEINSRYKTPSAKLIKMAKDAGIKFTFGTNNTGKELGRLEYSIQMIEECGLTPDDIFMPKKHEQKPVLVKGLPKEITG
ncbi:family 16 glycoside hydrolase [Flammeovirgaceae bacterium SG7u.111]|nr:family 16 glycoside hydrolase [Flammeovirgaceae bacterium SG7u.132]WPO37946.1 family 16 glycoside hydrolase [Flammeovirgaceae bacterium SG7u.111]